MCRAGDYECVYRSYTGENRPALPHTPTTKDPETDMNRKFAEMEERLRRFEGELSRVHARESTFSTQSPQQHHRMRASVRPEDSEKVSPIVVPDTSMGEQYDGEAEETSMNAMGVLAFSDDYVCGHFGNLACRPRKDDHLNRRRAIFEHCFDSSHIERNRNNA